MTISQLVQPFTEEYENRVYRAKDMKNNGDKILAHFCNYTPEEIIHAAGFVPWRLLEENIPGDRVDHLLPSYVCNYVTKTMGVLIGKELSFLDGYVFIHVCDALRGLYDVLNISQTKYTEFIGLPFDCTRDSSMSFFHDELLRFKKSLENLSGKQIRNDELSKSIGLYNQNRRLLQKVSSLRALETPLVSGVEFYDIVMSAMIMPKEKHNHLLSGLLEQIPSERTELAKKMRVFVSGSILDRQFVKTIEDAGTIIVGDDLCYGSRYFEDLVDEDNSDPFSALANRTVKECNCSCKYTNDRRIEKVVDNVAKSKADAVIFAIPKYCEPNQFELPYLMKRLRERNIPCLPLDVGESNNVSNEQNRTRIEAFVEMCM